MTKSQTYFEDSGQKNRVPLVLIHGFPLSSVMWEAQYDLLKRDYRTIRYDVRGFGRTPGGDGQFTMELFADDLLALLDQLQVSQAVLCGLSMGGYIALRFAERHLDRVRGLILADTKSEGDSNEAKVKRAEAVKLLKAQGVAAFLEGFTKGALGEQTQKDNPALTEDVKRMAFQNSPQDLSGALIAMAARTDTSGALPNFKVPSLVIVGEQDKLTPPEQSQKMAKALPQAQLVTIPGAGHLSNLEKPVVFTAAVVEFLKRLEL